jgi:DNA-binding NarL/FixJ family response regulator
MSAPAQTETGQLTPRELTIAAHVAQGLTNREIAQALYLSTKTIEAHLHSAYRKLGIRCRTQLALHVASLRMDGMRDADELVRQSDPTAGNIT